MYDRKIFGSYSKVFGNLRKSENFRKIFGNFRVAFDKVLKIFCYLRKVIGNLQKIVKNGMFMYCLDTSVLLEDTRKINTKPHLGLHWRIFHILTSDIDDFTDIKFMIETFSDPPRKSSVIFGNLRQCSVIFRNVLQRSCDLWTRFREFSEIFRKCSENRLKRRRQYLYIIKRTLHVSSEI